MRIPLLVGCQIYDVLLQIGSYIHALSISPEYTQCELTFYQPSCQLPMNLNAVFHLLRATSVTNRMHPLMRIAAPKDRWRQNQCQLLPGV